MRFGTAFHEIKSKNEKLKKKEESNMEKKALSSNEYMNFTTQPHITINLAIANAIAIAIVSCDFGCGYKVKIGEKKKYFSFSVPLSLMDMAEVCRYKKKCEQRN